MEDAATYSVSVSEDFSPAQTEWADEPQETTVDVVAPARADEEPRGELHTTEQPASDALVTCDAAGDAAGGCEDGAACECGAAYAAESAAAEQPAAIDPSKPTAERIIEALLFASDAPITAARLADLAELENAAAVTAAIERLNAQYASLGMGFRVEKIARGYQLLTLSSFEPWLSKMHQQHSETRLSDAALETLSIIAYKQPIIRSEVEAIRGVAAGDGINRLREMGLVKIVGRAEIVGRPLLYGTTKKFLDMFGLSDLSDLPPLEALRVRARQESAAATTAPTPSETPIADAHAA